MFSSVGVIFPSMVLGIWFRTARVCLDLLGMFRGLG